MFVPPRPIDVQYSILHIQHSTCGTSCWSWIRLVQEDKAAEAAAAAMDVDEDTPSNTAAQPKADEEKAGGKLHVLGIGGRRAKRGSSKATGTKKTPGEIRIQKGEDCPLHVQQLQSGLVFQNGAAVFSSEDGG